MLPASTKSSQSLFKTKNNTPMAIFDLGSAFSLALGPNCAAASPATELKTSQQALQCSAILRRASEKYEVPVHTSMIIYDSMVIYLKA